MKLIDNNHHFVFNDDVLAMHQFLDRDVLFEGDFKTIKGALLKTIIVKRRFAEGLGGKGAGMDADTADYGVLFDNGGFLTEFAGLNGGPISGRTGANYNDIELISIHDSNIAGLY